jgi:hypothetical protein
MNALIAWIRSGVDESIVLLVKKSFVALIAAVILYATVRLGAFHPTAAEGVGAEGALIAILHALYNYVLSGTSMPTIDGVPSHQASQDAAIAG